MTMYELNKWANTRVDSYITEAVEVVAAHGAVLAFPFSIGQLYELLGGG